MINMTWMIFLSTTLLIQLWYSWYFSGYFEKESPKKQLEICPSGHRDGQNVTVNKKQTKMKGKNLPQESMNPIPAQNDLKIT